MNHRCGNTLLFYQRYSVLCKAIGYMDLTEVFTILIHLMSVLYAGYCYSGDKAMNPSCNLEIIKTLEDYEYIQEGNIMIGGVITVNALVSRFRNTHSYDKFMLCLKPSPQNYKYLLDFRYFINEFNKTLFLKQNLTLGYHIYDSCGDVYKAQRSILQILSGLRDPIPNYSCAGKRNIVGFIGDLTSETTIPIAHILSVLGYSQISYGATDPFLSDRATFPFFFRTVQSEESQYFAITQLLKYFGWTWVGIITSDDVTGDRAYQLLTKYLSSEGICIDFTIKIRYGDSHKHYPLYREIIQRSSTSVVIFCGIMNMENAENVHELSDLLSEKTFIFPSNWLYNSLALGYALTLLNGSLIFMQNRADYTKNNLHFRQFLESVHPSAYPDDKLLEDIWMFYHLCLSKDEKRNILHEFLYSQHLHKCTGAERLIDINAFDDEFHTFSIMVAVHTLAVVSDGLHYLQLHNQQNLGTSKVIHYKYQIPRAQCSQSCLPGFRKATKSGAKSCCYDCVLCSEGEISIVTDSDNCFLCSDKEWPNEKKNQCIPKSEHFLSYTIDMISVVFTFMSLFFFAVTAMILTVFIKYQDTPIVRANKRSLSFLLLVSIKLSFLSVFLFLGRPVDITCMLRNITFGITFSIAVSSLQAKTIMVCVAFKATKPGSSWRKWVGVKLSNSVVLFCSSIQIIICMTWLAISPPFQELDLHTYPGTIIIQCNEGSAIGFYSVIGYMGLLAAVSFVLAFLARTLPDSFNEAKYITFSMLLFCSVWITMIPAYLSTKGKNTVCVEIFAILTSSAGLLFCIFLPKCYTILFRPDINKKSNLFLVKT
ncbi:vomeronasal type-2 receptor 116 [Xenopus laevis]|uniref:Vomeronasal type-2 receptor 116 n=1 Tax=Xenopus laevis TaxID=8355 RepID=A0A8J1MC77_XENLA|nr:vomeronasal type-2 receptor 116 [Xenopus laevis]